MKEEARMAARRMVQGIVGGMEIGGGKGSRQKKEGEGNKGRMWAVSQSNRGAEENKKGRGWAKTGGLLS